MGSLVLNMEILIKFLGLLRIKKYLINLATDNGGSIDEVCGMYKDTILHNVVIAPYSKGFLKFLIETKKANVNIKDKHGYTPLGLVCKEGKFNLLVKNNTSLINCANGANAHTLAKEQNTDMANYLEPLIYGK